MRTIFLKKVWEEEHNEKILSFLDCEGYEQKEIEPLGKYGYKISDKSLYKFITNRGIYFVENGKERLVHSFEHGSIDNDK